MDSRSNQRRKLSCGTQNFIAKDDGDRISNLPESVLCHILSLLQAKDAIRTCVLSKVWEYKWICLYNLKFDDSLRYTNQQPKKKLFANFVDRALAHCAMSMVKEFELLCKLSSCDPSRVKSWISAVLLHNNLERLHVSYREHSRRKLELPRCFYTCDSLTEVRLCCFNLKFPPFVCLPKLRVLHLRKIGFLSLKFSSSSSQLVLSFPVLQSFHLEDYKGLDKVKTLKIDAPLLANFLMLSNHRGMRIRTDGGLNHCEIELCVAKLKKFKCSGLLFHKFVWSGASPLGPVNISIKHTAYDDSLMLRKFITSPIFRSLQKLSASITILELSADIVEGLAYAEPTFGLPFFNKLLALRVSGEYFTENINVALLGLAKMAPTLETLILDKFRKSTGNNQAAESLPTHALPCLKKVIFERFGGDELALVKCLLKSALVLDELIVVTKHLGDAKSEIENQLSMLMFHNVCSNLSIKVVSKS